LSGTEKLLKGELAAAPLVGKRITLCVSGSIAAYKAALLARLLVRAGASVEPVMTRSALRFLGRATLEGLTGRPVQTDLFHGPGEPHVELARQSDLIAVVPATADLLARLAHGRADELITATLACARCPVLIAPAMHPNMWAHTLVQANVEHLRSQTGWRLLGPTLGEVASGEVGMGRMLEPEQLLEAIEQELSLVAPPPLDGAALPTAGAQRFSASGLTGRRIVVTAGPTIEDLDPVRSLTNRSSGKMGFALAASAARSGGRVTLIAGPVTLPTPAGVRRVDVRSALDMQAALGQALAEGPGADALVMCAAVSDYRPRQLSSSKLKRSAAALQLELVPNPDLLGEVGAARVGARPFLLGFAVETAAGEQLVAAARGKLAHKRVDAIVANSAQDALGTDQTRAVLVTAASEQPLGPGSKAAVADDIIAFLSAQLSSG
jgi:phosphopantothenoylcysteine decarboxylase / phosphopantothenate---cysteine ligase